MNINWFLGFVEGEGSFMILFIKKKDARFGYQIKPVFAIKLVISERKVLEKIKGFLDNIGGIYNESNALVRKKGTGYANDGVSFKVTKLGELKMISRLLKNLNFVSKNKQNDYKNWAKCLELLEKKKHLTREGFLRIAKLRSMMHKRKQFNKQSFGNIKKELSRQGGTY